MLSLSDRDAGTGLVMNKVMCDHVQTTPSVTDHFPNMFPARLQSLLDASMINIVELVKQLHLFLMHVVLQVCLHRHVACQQT